MMRTWIAGMVVLTTLSVGAAEPQWIWKAGTVGTGHVNFRTTVEVGKKPAKADLRITCDNQFKLSVNGKRVAEGTDWNRPVKMDIAKHLKAGKNTILVEAYNEGDQAGLLVDLNVDGKQVLSPASWEAQGKGEQAWTKAVTKGKHGVAPWGAVLNKTAAKRKAPAQGGSPATTEVATLPGFKAEKIYDVDNKTQGSWVGLTVDPKGRLITTDQYGAVYRMTLTPKVSVERLNVKVTGGHGALYAFDSLYIMAGEGTRGLFRLRDTNGDDQFDKEEFLMPIKGGGEHGPHSLVLSPDKKSIYVVAGNNADIPESANKYRMTKAWQEDQLLPRMADGRGHNRGRLAPGGYILKISPDAKSQEVICHGFRNQFDAAFNVDGELFAWDADMEYDIGAPWYRPTRVNHVVSGVDWGWRNGSGKWPEYFTDTLPPVVNIGPGSPTGVSNGLGAKFPAKYQKAIFINDWTYGTMYAIHLTQDGATYSGKAEEFVSGKPLPLTDVVINPVDGNMYFMVGGRRTTSGVYRLRYVGNESTAPVKSQGVHSLVQLRRSIEALHEDGVGPEAVAKALPHVGHDDRFIRYAARVALEKQPVAQWVGQLAKPANAWAAIELATATARLGEAKHQPAALAALNGLAYKGMATDQLLAALRAYQLVYARHGRLAPAETQAAIAALNPVYPHDDNYANRELAEVLLFLNAPGAVSKTVQQVLSAVDEDQGKILSDEILFRNDRYAAAAKRTEQFRPNVQQFALAFSLRSIKDGWTDADRASYFSWFPRAKTWQGGNSFGIFIENARKEALALVADETKRKEWDALSSKSLVAPRAIKPPKGPGRAWTVAEATKAVEGNLSARDFASGENLYHAVACAACHRFAGQGMGIGPDLTGSSSRYTLRDMLENIIEPSKVISDQYASTEFTLKDGSTVIGRVGGEENGIIQLMTNPYAADTTATLKASDVKSKKQHMVSHMPPGLVNALNADELSDLVAFIFSAGDPNHKYFKGGSAGSGKEEILFNGKNLDGWEGDPQFWSVKDGVIHGSTRVNPTKGNTFLIYTGKDVEDFHLTYEAKCFDNNSGMMYRAQRVGDAGYVLRGNQCDLHPKPEFLAMLYGEKERGIVTKRGETMTIDAAGKKTVVATRKPAAVDIKEWVTYEIICKGNRIVHKVNGEVAIDLTDDDAKRLKSGTLGIQLHAGPAQNVEFRNIRLTRF